MIPISWELGILTHSSLVTEMTPEVSSFLRSRASALFVGLGLRLMLNPEATIVAWGSLPGRTTDSQNRHLEGLSRATKLFHPFCPQFPTCLWHSGNSFDRLCSSCSDLIQVLSGEPEGNYSLLLCVSHPVSWLLGFWFFEKWSPNCRIILLISSTSPGLGGIGWEVLVDARNICSILQ